MAIWKTKWRAFWWGLAINTLPFPALVGLEHAQQALLLLAIDPALRGVVLAAPAGTGKSTLAQGIRALLVDDGMPFVSIPPHIDAENLLGGIDLESTLQRGQIVTQQGILARAHGGIAYIEGINLLTDASENILLSALDRGQIQVEREGVSLHSPTDFSLIATYDPAEGVPRGHLLDRVGLISGLPAQQSAGRRAAVVRHNLQATQDDWAEDMQFLRGLIITAREQLPAVQITAEQVEMLSGLALLYGVEGQRADLFAVRAACAAAAYELRDDVTDEDIQLAVNLVILPRATQIPSDENTPPPPPPPQEEEDGDNQEQADQPPPEQQADEDETDDAPPSEIAPAPEQILDALDSRLPDSLDELPFLHQRRGRAGSRGSTTGKRGRHIRSVVGDPRRNRIDLSATLRNAAPWQPIRREQNAEKYIHLAMEDIRVKQYRSKAGTLFCFAVDASGSMALHRMRQAKGAVHVLLEKAYVNRDRVALITFRGQQAELAMPPTQSVELAKKALDVLPTGGGTPLASALLLASDVAESARQKGIMQTVLILLTDGRGNVSLREDRNPEEELAGLGAYMRDSGIHIMVVDTKRNYLSRGEAAQLAEQLGADYAYLPNADGEKIADLAGALG